MLSPIALEHQHQQSAFDDGMDTDVVAGEAKRAKLFDAESF